MSKDIIWRRRLVFLLVLSLFLSCYLEDPNDPNHVSLASLKVDEIETSSGMILKISGVIFRDPFGEMKVEAKKENDCAVILIKSKQSDLNGEFQFGYDFVVPDDANKVCFGDVEHMIWDRTSGVKEIEFSHFTYAKIKQHLHTASILLVAMTFGVLIAVFIKRKIFVCFAFLGVLLISNLNECLPYFTDDPSTWWHLYLNGLLQVGLGLLVLHVFPAWLAYILVRKYRRKMIKNC